MTLNEFNQQDRALASDAIFECCASEKWAALLLKEFPFASEPQLVKLATDLWYDQCGREDWLEAFSHHPKIGDSESLKKKFASTQHLAGAEQAGVNLASAEVLSELAAANKIYEEKFGFIFIVCATGKPAEDMLALLQKRLHNEADDELSVAMGEQHKITILRLKKLLNKADWSAIKQGQLTTHVLDTSLGRPGNNMSILLQHKSGGGWKTIAQGLTNSDGRIPDLLPPGRQLPKNVYKLIFETEDYYKNKNLKGFYPQVEIQFSIYDEQHYHVPLLINPFGYSTYRGS